MSEKTAQQTYDDIGKELAARAPVKSAKMFGMPVLKVNGKAFAGFAEDQMTFKLKGEAHSRALGLSGAHLFDPGKMNRPMKEWVQFPAEHSAEWLDLAENALEYVSGLSG